MTGKEFVNNIRKHYLNSRKLIHDNSKYKIKRGLSHSISGATEDLFGLFIAEHLKHSGIELWVDKNISIKLNENERTKGFRPDLFIINNNVMTHYFDFKMDLGWNRDMKDYLNKKDLFISEITNGSEAWYTDTQRQKCYFEIAPNLKYQVVVVSEMNCGKGYQDNIAFAERLTNVEMYTLTGNVHPNTYNDNFDDIHIKSDEFQRLLVDTQNLLISGMN